MSCIATSGFLVDCKTTIGGIKAFWIGPYATISNAATIDPTTQLITALPTATWETYNMKPHVGNFVEAATVSKENNTIFYTQTLTAQFTKLTAARRLQIDTFSRGRHIIIVQDNNDNYWLMGYKDGAEVATESTETGTAKGDVNGYKITFTAEEAAKAYRLADSIVSDFDGTIDAPTL
jgi:hypothetical protein